MMETTMHEAAAPAAATLSSSTTVDPEALLARMLARSGRYAGQGVDGEGRNFRGELAIESLAGRGLFARFVARGSEDGEAFHEETLMFARDGLGGLACWVLTAQSTGMERLALVAASEPPPELATNELALHFATGDPADVTEYRAALRVVLRARGALELVWSCGLPGGEFAERSGLRLRPAAP